LIYPRRSSLLAAALLFFSSVTSSLGSAEVTEVTKAPLNYRPSLATDESGLWMLSDQGEREVQRSPLLMRDEALNAYVRKVVCDLAGDSCGSIRVYILDIPYFNANMSPNGAMQVWSGLLLRVKNEAQLAFVLSHEVSHFTQRHTLARYQSTRDTANSLVFLSLATGGIVGGIANLIAAGSLSAYSRDQEREADAMAFDTIVRKGYDPREASAIWEQLIAEINANPNREKADVFLSSHPPTDERLKVLRDKAAAVQAQRTDWRTGQESFIAAVRPYRMQWLEAELNRGKYTESKVLVDRLLGAEPSSGLLRFYQAEIYRRQNENVLAMAAYKQALASPDVPVAAYRGLGLVAMKAKDPAVARQAFNSYLAKSPAADDRAMIEFYLSEL